MNKYKNLTTRNICELLYFKFFFAFVLLLFFALQNIYSQTSATVTGTVTDSNGAVIAGTEVELINDETAQRAIQMTDSNGQYRFSDLSPGNYRLIVNRQGFRRVTNVFVISGAGQVLNLDFQLYPRGVSETVVVTGTRSEQEIGKISSAVSVVSNESIQQTGQRVSTLEEPLKRIPGVRVEDELGGNGSRVRIIIRGAGTRANSPAGSGVRGVRVLVDGIPKNNAGGSAQDLINIDLESAQRIEVLKGPSSVLYGNQSGGVVNILTENPPPTKFTIGYRQTFGAFGLFKEHLSMGGQYGRFGFYASGFRNDQEGYREQSRFHNTGFNAKLNYIVDNRSNLMVILGYDDNYQQSPGPLTEEQFRADPRQASPAFLANDVFAVVKEFRLGAVYHRELFGEDDLEITGYFIPRTLGPFQQIGVFIDQTFYNRGFNVRYLNERNLGNFGNRFTIGAEYQNTPIRTPISLRPSNILIIDRDETADVAGVYFLNEFSVLPNLTVTAGGRFDYVKFTSQDVANNTERVGRTFRKFTPKIGVAYQPTDMFSVYANFSQGFETPIIGELRVLPGGIFGFNDTLDPQTLTNYEAGVRGSFLDNKISLEAAIFRQNINDLISPFGAFPNNSFQNVGDVRQKGLELSSVVTPLDGLSLTGSYTYSDFVFTRYDNGIDNFTGNRQPGVPKHSFFGEIFYIFPFGLFGAVESQYVGRFFANDANNFIHPPYAVTNLRFGYKQPEGVYRIRFEPFLGIRNIFDRRYSAFAIINDSGRRFFNPLPGINVYGGFVVRY